MSEAPPPPTEKPRARAKPSLLVLGLLVGNLGATGFVVWRLLTTSTAAHAEHAAATPPDPTQVSGPLIALDPFVVNLNEPGAPRYLKVGIELEVTAAEDVRKIDRAKQLVREAILGYLSDRKLADTLGEQGKIKIRGDLVARIEQLVGHGVVKRMFFTEFVVQ